MKTAIVAVSTAVGAILGVSVAIANHETGHTTATGFESEEVRIVRHSFPPSDYPGGQWETTSGTWVTVPGAFVTVTVPPGEQGLIVARFSPSVICSGTGICESRIVIHGVEGHPNKPVYFNPGSTNNWGVMYTERSRGPLPPGTYAVRAQVLTTYGTSGTTLYVRSYHLTVERFRR
jgi:hypothetical protein